MRGSASVPVTPKGTSDGPTARTSTGLLPPVPLMTTPTVNVSPGEAIAVITEIFATRPGRATVSRAIELVALPAGFVTTTEYSPASATPGAASVSVAEFAPA